MIVPKNITQEELQELYDSVCARSFNVSVNDMSDDEVFVLIGYELWKDGMDWDIVPQVVAGQNIMYDRYESVQTLKRIFNYK